MSEIEQQFFEWLNRACALIERLAHPKRFVLWLLMDAKLPRRITRMLDPFAPYLFGLAIGSRPVRVAYGHTPLERFLSVVRIDERIRWLKSWL